MKLHEAIFELIKQFGPDTLLEKRFVNLLSDYLAFKDYPSLQQVVRDFVCDENYSAFIRELSSSTRDDIKLFAGKTSVDFQKKTKFKRDLVVYVIDCFLYGMNLSKSVREPSSNGYDVYAEESSNILQTLQSQLNELKQEYKCLLDELSTHIDDVAFNSISYYSVEAQNRLYALQLKISVISEKLGTNDKIWCKTLYEVKEKAFADAKRNAVNKIIAEEKENYSKVLEGCVIKPNISNIFNSECFIDKTDERLKPIEERIIKLGSMIGVVSDAFCKNEKSRVLANYSETKKKIAKEYIADLKVKYTNEVENCIVKPGSSYISKSGYFAEDTDSKLRPIEESIDKLNVLLGVTNDHFCLDERKRILAKYCIDSSKRTKQIIFKIIIPAVIALGSALTGGSYLSSIDEINTFDSQVAEIQELNKSGLYAESIAKSMSARDGYTGSFMASSYKNDAMQFADLAFNNLCAQIDKLISEDKYYDALQLIGNIPNSYLSENPEANKYVETFKDNLAKVIPNAIENFIQSISNNSGYLSESDKTKLDELLKLDPNNYWLNFIKNKQK